MVENFSEYRKENSFFWGWVRWFFRGGIILLGRESGEVYFILW